MDKICKGHIEIKPVVKKIKKVPATLSGNFTISKLHQDYLLIAASDAKKESMIAGPRPAII